MARVEVTQQAILSQFEIFTVPRAVVVLWRLGVAAAALAHHLVVFRDAGISGDGGVLLAGILPAAPEARLGPLPRRPAIGGS